MDRIQQFCQKRSKATQHSKNICPSQTVLNPWSYYSYQYTKQQNLTLSIAVDIPKTGEKISTRTQPANHLARTKGIKRVNISVRQTNLWSRSEEKSGTSGHRPVKCWFDKELALRKQKPETADITEEQVSHLVMVQY